MQHQMQESGQEGQEISTEDKLSTLNWTQVVDQILNAYSFV